MWTLLSLLLKKYHPIVGTNNEDIVDVDVIMNAITDAQIPTVPTTIGPIHFD